MNQKVDTGAANVTEIGGPTPTNPAGEQVPQAGNAITPTSKKVGAKAADKNQPTAEAKIDGSNGNDDALSGERVTIMFFEQDTDVGKLPVEVGLNGIVYRMPRNVKCNVPVEVLSVIKDAVEIVYEAMGATVVERRRPRFSYEILG